MSDVNPVAEHALVSVSIEMTHSDYLDKIEERMGICIACHTWHDDCDPDLYAGECDVCVEPLVFGLEELFMMGNLDTSGIAADGG